jgi:hypothetical protein
MKQLLQQLRVVGHRFLHKWKAKEWMQAGQFSHRASGTRLHLNEAHKRPEIAGAVNVKP